MIEFDLTKPKKPLVGVAPRNPLYVPTTPGQGDALKIPLIKRDARGIYVEDPRRDKFRHGVDHVPVVMGIGRTAFLANISIGSPRQSFTVLLDTGSSTLAVFAKMPASHRVTMTHDGFHRPGPRTSTGARRGRGRGEGERAMRLQEPLQEGADATAEGGGREGGRGARGQRKQSPATASGVGADQDAVSALQTGAWVLPAAPAQGRGGDRRGGGGRGDWGLDVGGLRNTGVALAAICSGVLAVFAAARKRLRAVPH